MLFVRVKLGLAINWGRDLRQIKFEFIFRIDAALEVWTGLQKFFKSNSLGEDSWTTCIEGHRV